MPTTIYASLRAYVADPTGLAIKLYNGATLLNSGGDTLTHVGNGYFSASIAETIAAIDYDVVIEKDGVGVEDGVLFAGQTVVGVEGISGDASLANQELILSAIGAIDIEPTVSITIPVIEYQSLIEPYDKMVRYRGTAWSIAVQGLVSIPAKCFFTMKRNDEADANSIVQIVKSNPPDGNLDGLKILNGAVAQAMANGSIAYSSYTESGQTRYRATMTLAAEATAAFRVRDYRFDFKDVAADAVLAEGELRVVAPVTASTF